MSPEATLHRTGDVTACLAGWLVRCVRVWAALHAAPRQEATQRAPEPHPAHDSDVTVCARRAPAPPEGASSQVRPEPILRSVRPSQLCVLAGW